MKNLKKNRGITLIALVVTIIILLVLAGITLSFVSGENGILKRATNAVDVNKKATAEEQANLLLVDLEAQYYEKKYVENEEGLTTLDEYLKKELEEGKTTDSGEYTVKIEGEQVIVSKDGNQILEGTLSEGEVVGWTGNSSGANPPTLPETENPVPDNPTLGKTDKSKNRNLAGTTQYTYKNPVIPQGFSAIDEGQAIWEYTDGTKAEVKGWNEGLVIEDEIGNQFVWVPVDGENVKYEKWCTQGFSYSGCRDDTWVCPVSSENTQIDTYEGFYVARYEAGNNNASSSSTKPNNTTTTVKPLSIAGTKVWNNIDYGKVNIVSKLMVNDESIYGNNKSGLITGTQWDTIMKWYTSSGITIDENKNWGTCYNLTYSGNGKYFFRGGTSVETWKEGAFLHEANEGKQIYHASGLNRNGIQKNIADLSGNLWEFTSEIFGNKCVDRGDGANSNYSISERSSLDKTSTASNLGFRVVLFIQ